MLYKVPDTAFKGFDQLLGAPDHVLTVCLTEFISVQNHTRKSPLPSFPLPIQPLARRPDFWALLG
jgi:hypothetical protein